MGGKAIGIAVVEIAIQIAVRAVACGRVAAKRQIDGGRRDLILGWQGLRVCREIVFVDLGGDVEGIRQLGGKLGNVDFLCRVSGESDAGEKRAEHKAECQKIRESFAYQFHG